MDGISIKKGMFTMMKMEMMICGDNEVAPKIVEEMRGTRLK